MDERTSGLSRAALRLAREIELLREYRTRVVTGKLDVRETVRELPEEPRDADEPSTGLIDDLLEEEAAVG